MGQFKRHDFAGIRQSEEGNILVVGGTGSGKSSGIIKPTLQTWTGPIFALDIKGEVSNCYRQYAKSCSYGGKARPCIDFDPTQEEGIGYDPFCWLAKDDEENLVTNILDLAYALIPLTPDIKEPFWIESERAILAAALMYHFKIGLGFSETIIKILSSPILSLCESMEEYGCAEVKMMITGMKDLNGTTLASIDRGLRNHLLLFGTDKRIINTFRSKQEGVPCFDWEDLTDNNIFLRVPADKLDVWAPAIRLMLIQLIRYLERRPEKYGPDGEYTQPTLLLLDEFARIGKVECMVDAVATLRPNAVNICFVLQSLAQLDAVYGADQRRIILDNCPWKAILRVGDAETQRAISDLVGTTNVFHQNASISYDRYGKPIGYSYTAVESREFRIQPHELATMDDVLLLTPYGTCCVDKYNKQRLLRDKASLSLDRWLK